MEPWTTYKKHHAQIKAAIKRQGVRETARRAGVTPMMVSRFCNDPQTKAVDVFYALAAATGHELRISNPVEEITAAAAEARRLVKRYKSTPSSSA